jgi:hypothetical protein
VWSNRRRLALAAGILVAAASGFGYGYLSRARGLFPHDLVSPLLGASGQQAAKPAPSPSAGAPAMTDDQRERAEALMSLGYAAGYSPRFERSGVVTHVAGAVDRGFNLVVSGHENSAVLMDMEGQVVHRWAKTFEEVWPGRKAVGADVDRARYWKRVHLFPNGDLIAMFEGSGLVKLDRQSSVLWAYADPVHHDLDIDPAGNVLVLVKRAHVVPTFDPTRPVLEDSINVVSSDGKRQRSISVLNALLQSPFAPLLRFHRIATGDVLHTNTLTVLDGRQARRLPAFQRGNVLVALRSLDFVGIIDLEKREFVWGLAGLWRQPHEPSLVDDGRLLVFDNYGRWTGNAHRSRVFEIDPVSQQITWAYAGEPEFFSKVVGLAQRLPNGNTLVTVSTEGRALEVTRDGETVWEFRNPHEVVEGGVRRAATLFEVVRLPASRVPWLRH